MRIILYIFFNLYIIGHISAQTADSSGNTNWTYRRTQTGLTEKGKFKQGLRHGVWMYTDDSGQLVLKEKYKNGKRIWAFFYKNQRIIATVNRHGIMRKRPDCGC